VKRRYELRAPKRVAQRGAVECGIQVRRAPALGIEDRAFEVSESRVSQRQARPVRLDLPESEGPEQHLRRIEGQLVAGLRILGGDVAGPESAREIEHVVDDVAAGAGLAGVRDERIEEVAAPRVREADECRDGSQATQLATILVRYRIVGIVRAHAEKTRR